MTMTISTSISVTGKWRAYVTEPDNDSVVFETELFADVLEPVKLARKWCEDNGHNFVIE